MTVHCSGERRLLVTNEVRRPWGKGCVLETKGVRLRAELEMKQLNNPILISPWVKAGKQNLLKPHNSRINISHRVLIPFYKRLFSKVRRSRLCIFRSDCFTKKLTNLVISITIKDKISYR